MHLQNLLEKPVIPLKLEFPRSASDGIQTLSINIRIFDRRNSWRSLLTKDMLVNFKYRELCNNDREYVIQDKRAKNIRKTWKLSDSVEKFLKSFKRPRNQLRAMIIEKPFTRRRQQHGLKRHPGTTRKAGRRGALKRLPTGH